MSYREQLIAVQRKVLAAIRRDIRQSLGKEPAELKRYYRAYKRRFAQPFEPVKREDVIRACLAADVVYVGDYHTLASAQRMALGLLEEIRKRFKGELILGMEMLQVTDQSATDQWLSGEFDEERFLSEIEYDKNWGFEWRNFKPLFDFVRDNGIRVIGINCDVHVRQASLTERDTCAAMAVSHALIRNPKAKLLVVDGDMHIAPSHLPKRVNALLRDVGTRRRSVIVYQNSTTIHWRLVEQGREQEVDAVRLSPREFSIQHTHPIVKFQSYLNWIEYEEELAHGAPEWIAGDGAERLHNQLLRFVESIASTLGIKEDLSDFSVYTVDDLHYLDDLQKIHVYSVEEIGLVAIQILKGESHFLPDGDMIYLANLTVNHAAEEAAHFINFKLSGPPPKVQSHEHDFYHRTVREALGFFGSKIINPNRLAYREADFREVEKELRGQRLGTKGRDLRKVSRVVLHHIDIEDVVLSGDRRPPSRLPKTYWQELSVFLGAAHALGYRMGLWLYTALDQGAITRDEIRELFCRRFDELGSARQTYFDLLWLLADVVVPFEKRREKF